MDQILKDVIEPLLRGSPPKDGKEKLEKVLVDPEGLMMILQLMSSSDDHEVRKFIAIIVKLRFARGSSWMKYADPIRERIKSGIIEAYSKEKDESVRKAFAYVIGMIGKHELSKNKWPELVNFITNLYQRGNEEKEVAFELIYAMTEVSPHCFDASSKKLEPYFAHALSNKSSEANYTLPSKAIRVLISLLNQPEHNRQLQKIVEDKFNDVMFVLKLYSEADPNLCIELLDIVEVALNNKIWSKKSVELLQFLMTLAKDDMVTVEVKTKAVYLVGIFACSKKRFLSKKPICLSEIVGMTYTFLSTQPDDAESEEYFAENDDEMTLMSAGSTLLDTLASNISPDKLLQPLINSMCSASNDCQFKANFVALGIIAEHCSDRLRHNHISDLVERLCFGLSHPSPIVNNAAYFALGEFSEFLQPELSKYASTIVSYLSTSLDAMITSLNSQTTPGRTKSIERKLSSIESFLSGLSVDDAEVDNRAEFNEKMQVVIKQLFQLINTNYPISVQTEVLDVILALVTSCKEEMKPYFGDIVEMLKVYFGQNYSDDTLAIFVSAVNVLGGIWKSCELQELENIWQFSINLIGNLKGSEPEVKKSLYALAGCIVEASSNLMLPYMQTLIEATVESLKNIEDGGDEEDAKDDENDAIMSEEGATESDCKHFEVENAYAEEKEAAIYLTKTFFEHFGKEMNAFSGALVEEIFKLTFSSVEGINEAAVETLPRILLHILRYQPFTDETKKCVNMVMNRLLKMASEEPEPTAATNALQSVRVLIEGIFPNKSAIYTDLIAESQMPIAQFLAQEFGQSITMLVHNVFDGKVAALGSSDNGDEDDSSDEECSRAENEEYLVECAGDLLPLIGRLVPGANFQTFMQTFNKYLNPMLNQSYGSSRKSFALGIYAECIQPLAVDPAFAQDSILKMYEMFKKHFDLADHNVCCNCIFAMGELCFLCTDTLGPNRIKEVYDSANMVCALGKNTRARDNAVAAISRIALRSPSIVERNVVDDVLNYFPMKKDFAENYVILHLIKTLSDSGSLGDKVAHIITGLATIITDKIHTTEVSETTKLLARQLLEELRNKYGTDFENAVSSLPDYTKNSLIALL